MSDWTDMNFNPLDYQDRIVIDKFGIVEYDGLEDLILISYKLSSERSKIYFYLFHILIS